VCMLCVGGGCRCGVHSANRGFVLHLCLREMKMTTTRLAQAANLKMGLLCARARKDTHTHHLHRVYYEQRTPFAAFILPASWRARATHSSKPAKPHCIAPPLRAVDMYLKIACKKKKHKVKGYRRIRKERKMYASLLPVFASWS
jgi:hypothetical protein